MMGLSEIRRLSREAAEIAQEEGKIPYVPNDVDEILNEEFTIPNFGDYVPPGWGHAAQQWFVDKEGWGKSGEPALTQDEFIGQLAEYHKKNPSHGIAIIQEGQFQVYVGAFYPFKDHLTRAEVEAQLNRLLEKNRRALDNLANL